MLGKKLYYLNAFLCILSIFRIGMSLEIIIQINIFNGWISAILNGVFIGLCLLLLFTVSLVIAINLIKKNYESNLIEFYKSLFIGRMKKTTILCIIGWVLLFIFTLLAFKSTLEVITTFFAIMIIVWNIQSALIVSSNNKIK